MNQRDRYWSDPAYRLKRVNHSRKRLGLPPYEYTFEIATRGPNEQEKA